MMRRAGLELAKLDVHLLTHRQIILAGRTVFLATIILVVAAAVAPIVVHDHDGTLAPADHDVRLVADLVMHDVLTAAHVANAQPERVALGVDRDHGSLDARRRRFLCLDLDGVGNQEVLLGQAGIHLDDVPVLQLVKEVVRRQAIASVSQQNAAADVHLDLPARERVLIARQDLHIDALDGGVDAHDTTAQFGQLDFAVHPCRLDRQLEIEPVLALVQGFVQQHVDGDLRHLASLHVDVVLHDERVARTAHVQRHGNTEPIASPHRGRIDGHAHPVVTATRNLQQGDEGTSRLEVDQLDLDRLAQQWLGTVASNQLDIRHHQLEGGQVVLGRVADQHGNTARHHLIAELVAAGEHQEHAAWQHPVHAHDLHRIICAPASWD
ncbi:MAG: hypothetical protein U1E76_16530 [Planctomycetota bacterium]